MKELIEKVEQWAEVRKLHTADPKAQALKVIEEFTEMIIAREQNDTAEVIDGIGDTYVTVIILSKQLDLDLTRMFDFKEGMLKRFEENSLFGDIRERTIDDKTFLVKLISDVATFVSKGITRALFVTLIDALVVADLLADEYNTTPKQCLQTAYNEIKDRKGILIDGTFVKYDDLSDEGKAVLDNA